MKIKKFLFAIFTCITFLLSSHAFSNPINVEDPYQHINEKIFTFNSNLDEALFKPIAAGYAKVVPLQARNSISNFYQNFESPTVIANDLLQGDFLHAMADTWRFFINSTFGIFGLFDIAGKMNVPIPFHPNDLGLTLQYWGLNDPKYVVIPFFGPSTDVDLLGRVVDYYAFTPYPYIHPYYDRYIILGIYFLNQRAQLLQFNNLLETAALNPYVFVRNAYLQRRKAQLEQLRVFIKAEYSSLEDTEPGYFIKPSHSWSQAK